MRPSNRHQSLVKLSNYLVAAVFVLMPFTAFITTWLGSSFGYIDVFRIWKEILLMVVAIPTAYVAASDTQIRSWLRKNWLPRLIILYVLLHLLIGIFALSGSKVNASALIYGLLINMRFLGFFMIVLVLSKQSDFLKSNWHKLILLPGILVILFGIFQRLVLPYDFLKHFGYGPNTIPAYHTVDQKLAYVRIQSTLRGPNPLGAYLSMLIPLFLVGLKKRNQQIITILGGLLALFYTYSRSAWIGLAIITSLIVFLIYRNSRKFKPVIYSAVFITLCISTGVFLLRNNLAIQNTFFHTDVTSKSRISPNAGRLSGLEDGLKDLVNEPLGRGPGTAGPASVRNSQSSRIAENYFVQIGQEVGIIGVVLFIAINFLVAKTLWQRRDEKLAVILLAILVGLTFINLVSHAWADETLAYIWWGLAAVAVSPVILNKERK